MCPSSYIHLRFSFFSFSFANPTFSLGWEDKGSVSELFGEVLSLWKACNPSSLIYKRMEQLQAWLHPSWVDCLCIRITVHQLAFPAEPKSHLRFASPSGAGEVSLKTGQVEEWNKPQRDYEWYRNWFLRTPVTGKLFCIQPPSAKHTWKSSEIAKRIWVLHQPHTQPPFCTWK